MSKSLRLSVPPQLRRGGTKHDELEYVDGGRDLLLYTIDILGLNDLGSSRMLDMGCGTKFTQAILSYDIPIGEYIGIDVYREMIDFLNSSTDDPRFSFHRVNTHNDMYNINGEELSADTQLPIEEYSCDIVCLFSVFTHLAPTDFTNMLKVMRRYAKAGAQLIFTLYLDELSHNGHGLIEQIAKKEGGTWKPSGDGFRDAYPDKPLQWALYSRKHALELMEGTGWEVEQLCLPTAEAQHHFICRAK